MFTEEEGFVVKAGDTFYLCGLSDSKNPITFGKVVDGIQTLVTADGLLVFQTQ